MAIKPTPRQEKSAQTRQMLIDSAMELFRDNDVDQVTIDDICRNCGVTKGTFYNQFSSKDHVVTISLNIFSDRYIQERFRLDESRPLLEQLTHLLLCNFAFFRSMGKKMTRSSYESQIRSCVEVRISGRSFVDNLLALVRRGIRENRFPMKLGEDQIYMMFIGWYTGMLMKWCTQADSLDLTLDWEEIIRAQLELMVEG